MHSFKEWVDHWLFVFFLPFLSFFHYVLFQNESFIVFLQPATAENPFSPDSPSPYSSIFFIFFWLHGDLFPSKCKWAPRDPRGCWVWNVSIFRIVNPQTAALFQPGLQFLNNASGKRQSRSCNFYHFTWAPRFLLQEPSYVSCCCGDWVWAWTDGSADMENHTEKIPDGETQSIGVLFSFLLAAPR